MRTDFAELCDDLEGDLCQARLEHLEARRRLRAADTPEHRATEARCRMRLDVLLDVLMELRGARSHPPTS